MIAIIDYDAGNIKSVEKALHFLGQKAVVTGDKETILSGRESDTAGSGSVRRRHEYRSGREGWSV